MKLCLYNLHKDEAHLKCKTALEACGFSIEQDDIVRGFISASLVADFPKPLACITTRVTNEPYGVSISIVSSFLSVRFGNFWHNPDNEEQLVDELLTGFRQHSVPGNVSFKESPGELVGLPA